MAFPRAAISNLIVDLLDEGTVVRWAGEPEQENGSSDTDVVLTVKRGKSLGTTEERRVWVNDKQAYSLDITKSNVWSVTIDIQTYDANGQADDIAADLALRLRWPSSIRSIQDAGLTTVRIGDVVSSTRYDGESRECFGAVLECLFGQRLTSHVSDDGGENIATVASVVGTLHGGSPDPVTVTNTDVPVGG